MTQNRYLSITGCTLTLQHGDQNFVSSFEVESWNSSSYNLSTFSIMCVPNFRVQRHATRESTPR